MQLTPVRLCVLATATLMTCSAVAPDAARAQERSGPEVQLQIGGLVPLSALPVSDSDFPPPHGEVALGRAAVLGARLVWPLPGRFSLGAGIDAGKPRPIPTLKGELCEWEGSQPWMDDDCRAPRVKPRLWLIQGQLEVVADTDGPFGAGVGIAPRYLSRLDGTCQLIWRACPFAGEIDRHPTFTVGLVASATVRPTVAGRRFDLRLSNTAIRVEGSFQHELRVGMGVPVLSWSRTDR